MSVYLNLTQALTHSATTAGFVHMVIVPSFAQFCHLKVKANAAWLSFPCFGAKIVCMRVRVNWKIFYWKRNMHADTQKMDVVLSWLVVLDRIYKLSSLDYILD